MHKKETQRTQHELFTPADSLVPVTTLQLVISYLWLYQRLFLSYLQSFKVAASQSTAAARDLYSDSVKDVVRWSITPSLSLWAPPASTFLLYWASPLAHTWTETCGEFLLQTLQCWSHRAVFHLTWVRGRVRGAAAALPKMSHSGLQTGRWRVGGVAFSSCTFLPTFHRALTPWH